MAKIQSPDHTYFRVPRIEDCTGTVTEQTRRRRLRRACALCGEPCWWDPKRFDVVRVSHIQTVCYQCSARRKGGGHG